MVSTKVPRETRLDIIRGLAMLVIAVNHVSVAFRGYGLDGIDIPTPTSVGYSSSAAIFVAMSGYMAGLIYSRKPQPARAVLARARTLYVYNALLFLAVLPLLLMMDRVEAIQWDAQTLYDRPAVGLAQFLFLIRAPALLDVLQLYVVFMLVTPAALWLLRRSPSLVLAISLAIWAACQVAAAVGLFDPEIFEWNFNPAAWQLMFFAPMVFGAGRGHEAVFDLLARRRVITIGLAAAAAVFAVAKVLHLERAIPDYALLTSKGNLGALRLIHAPIIMFLYCGILAFSPRLPHLAVLRALACVGRQTLPCYLASAWITYVLAVAWDRYTGTYRTYLAAALVAVLVTLIVAAVNDARGRGRAGRAADPSAGGAGPERTAV